MATPLVKCGLRAQPPAAQPRLRAGCSTAPLTPVAAAVRGSPRRAGCTAAGRLATAAASAGGESGAGGGGGARARGDVSAAAAPGASDGLSAAQSEKERAKAEKAAAAAAARAEKAEAAKAAKAEKAAAVAEAKAAKAAVLAAVKEAKTSTKQQRSDKVKTQRTEEKQSDRATRQAELAARAEADEARKRGAGFAPMQVSRAKELADAAEMRAARRAAAQAAKDKKAREIFSGDEDDTTAAADSDADGSSIEAILAAATADAEGKAAGVVVTTKKRILEAAPELLLDKAAAQPIMKRWYTVTTRWGSEEMVEPLVARVLSEAAAREGFTFMLVTPRAPTEDDWERNQDPPRPTIEAGRELHAPGWPQNSGELLVQGQLLLRAPLSSTTCFELRSTGVQLVGAGKAMMGLSTEYEAPAPLSLNVLEKFRVAINAKPVVAKSAAVAEEDAPAAAVEAAPLLPELNAAADGAPTWPEPQQGGEYIFDEYMAESAAAADLAALELDGSGGFDEFDAPPMDLVAEAREWEARLSRSVSAVADAAARSKAMARGVPPPPPSLAEQVTAFRAGQQPAAPESGALGEALKSFRSDLAAARQS